MVQVNLMKYRSDFQVVEKGVPQYSILGPVLLIMYINNIVHHGGIISYADDTSLVMYGNNLVSVVDTTEMLLRNTV